MMHAVIKPGAGVAIFRTHNLDRQSHHIAGGNADENAGSYKQHQRIRHIRHQRDGDRTNGKTAHHHQIGSRPAFRQPRPQGDRDHVGDGAIADQQPGKRHIATPLHHQGGTEGHHHQKSAIEHRPDHPSDHHKRDLALGNSGFRLGGFSHSCSWRDGLSRRAINERHQQHSGQRAQPGHQEHRVPAPGFGNHPLGPQTDGDPHRPAVHQDRHGRDNFAPLKQISDQLDHGDRDHDAANPDHETSGTRNPEPIGPGHHEAAQGHQPEPDQHHALFAKPPPGDPRRQGGDKPQRAEKPDQRADFGEVDAQIEHQQRRH